jgi:hypothetical protein
MTGEAARATAESAGMATKATWVTASESAPHVAPTAAVEATATTAVRAATTTTTMSPATTTAVLSECRRSYREQSGEAHSPQRGLVT